MNKFLLIAMSLMIVGTAKANVKAPGEFVPSLCSTGAEDVISTQIVAVRSVCVGDIVEVSRAIQLTLNDGTTRLYQVNFVGGLKGMGMGTAKFTGSSTTDFNDEIEGKLVQSSGVTTTNYIELTTSGNLKFSGSLDFVFTTM